MQLLDEIEEPLQDESEPLRLIDPSQWLKPQRGAAEVIPTPSQEIREEASMAIQVKELGLRVGVLEPLRAQKIPQGALATAGGTEHEEMPQVPHMIHHLKERMLLRLRIEPWEAPEVLIPLWSWPCGGEPWAEMCQRERMLRGAPDIIPSIARMARQPRRRGMVPFGRRHKALAVKRLHDDGQLGLRRRRVGIPDRHGTRKFAIRHHIGPDLLPGQVRLVGLVRGIRI